MIEDKELQAITNIINSLAALEPDAKGRVIEYVLKRLGISPNSALASRLNAPVDAVNLSMDRSGSNSLSPRQIDIRTLRDEKKPKTAIEMAALVAYYLSEVAPENERKESINPEDVTKYFKQAGFDLPEGQPRFTLQNAKNAGYLDSTAERGNYKLNPVGYNLVAYNLPQSNSIITKRKKTKKVKPKNKKAA